MEDKTRLLGKIDINSLIQTFGEIQTDEVIVTDERIRHIIERHLQDYKLFLEYGVFAVTNPDYIIKDGKCDGTIFMIKRLIDTNINVVVRVALSTDKKGLKNSVMTSYRLRDRNLKRMMEKNEILYKNG
ncbi:MAG: hypothetical protein IKL49_01645 [Lachnospiraceae bacterium]|nr:hypothetical protein [Lachnospiraceae bacterium]